MKNTKVMANIPVIFMKEGASFVAFSPALDLYEHGDSYEDVFDAFKTKLAIFISELIKMGTLEKVLLECGWIKTKNRLAPPQIIDRKIESVQIAL